MCLPSWLTLPLACPTEVWGGRAGAAAPSPAPLVTSKSKSIIRSAQSALANTQATLKCACICDACHYPGDAFSPSVTFSHLSVTAELQQPGGQKSSFQPMERVSDQELRVTGITRPISSLTIGLGNTTLLFGSCTWLQVSHHSEYIIMQKKAY